MNTKQLSRRRFLRTTLLGVAGAGTVFHNANRLRAQTSPLITREPGPGEQFTVGILGCGNRSKSHIQSLNQVPDIRIGALCDRVPHKMDRRQELIEGSASPQKYTDLEQMVRQEDLDAVAVVLPNHLHKEATITALESGKHVFCEKPMALTVADCNQMIAAAERSRRALQIGTQRRHSTGMTAAVKEIRNSPVGTILSSDIHSYRGDWRVPAEDEYPPGTEYWRLNQAKCGGVVYEMGAHIIDINNWIVDSEPVQVTSLQGVNNYSLRDRDSTDHAGVLVRYANEAMMNYGGNLYNYGADSHNYFFAVHGTIALSTSELVINCGRPNGFPEQGPLPEPLHMDLPAMDGTTQQWAHFAQVMSGNAEPYPGGYIGRQTIRICEGAIRSMEERITIAVSELG